jgi:ubiquilin
LKDEDALSVYKLKDGNTVHLVRGRKQETTPVASQPSTPTQPDTTRSQQLPPLGSFGAGPGGFPGMQMPTGMQMPAGMPGMPGMGGMGGMGQMPGMGN